MKKNKNKNKINPRVKKKEIKKSKLKIRYLWNNKFRKIEKKKIYWKVKINKKKKNNLVPVIPVAIGTGNQNRPFGSGRVIINIISHISTTTSSKESGSFWRQPENISD